MNGKNERVFAIDEAGRGPVIASMFIAGVLITEDKAKELREMGVKDSKKVSQSDRENLIHEVKEKSDYVDFREVSASEIDFERQRISLNELEAREMAGLIEKALEDREFDKLILDTPDPKASKFVDRINKYVDIPDEVEIIAEHGADETYPSCSAASVVAKVNRDENVREIGEEIGVDLGSGYPHDSAVKKYLKNALKDGEFPDFVRSSWETAKRIKRDEEQSKLEDY